MDGHGPMWNSAFYRRGRELPDSVEFLRYPHFMNHFLDQFKSSRTYSIQKITAAFDYDKAGSNQIPSLETSGLLQPH